MTHPRYLAPILALALTSCAFLSGLVRTAGPAVCERLVDVVFPGSDVIAARLCPEVADAFAEALAEGGDGGRVSRRGGECDPLPVSQIDADASIPPGAYVCRERVGGDEEARRLYRLAGNISADKRRARAQDGGR